MSFFRFVLFLIVCLTISCFEKCNGMLKPKSPFCKDDGEFHTEVGSLEMKSISDKDCKDLPLKMVSNGSALLDVNLSAYEYRGRFRSFPLVNISIPYIKFTSMLMRLQIADGTVTKCRNFSIKSNQDTQTHPLTMFWDCRWFNSTYKESLMTVEFLASNKTAFNYKKFSFQLPKYDVQNTDSLHTKLFLYQEEIPGCVKFHVGRSTEILKVSGYRFQLQECIDNCTEAKSEPALETNKSSIEFCESLKFHTLYKVSVEPKICSGNNCSWGTTSFSHEFVTRPAESYTDLYMGLMVTLTVFLIILIVFFSWHVAKIHYSQKISKSNRCILVYEPSSKSHLDVVKELASFLRDMKENVLFGETDIDIGEIGTDWWPRELERADVVLIVSNPIQKHYIDMFKASIHAPVFKGGIVKDSLRCLINDSSRSKRYIRILLPYCQRTDFYDFTRAKPCYHIFEDRQRLFRKIKGIHETCLSRANIWSSYSVFDTDSWRNLEAAIKNYDQGEETINIKSSKYHEDDQYLHSLVQESSSSEDELDISDTEYKVKMLDGVKDNDSSDAESDVLPMHTKNHTTGSQTLSTDISVEISAEDFGEEMKALRNFLPRKM